ncbi:MAG TPA: peroxiredoxin [Gammaproteobacteria bacterium]|nr:peroxiredoxin [Gammaproteobacteria bacterium]
MLGRILRTLAFVLPFAAARAAPEAGTPAPDFRLQDQNGTWHTLADYRGKWVVLYFYPKDDTPGCTKQACTFRDDIFKFKAEDAVILGVSLDDVRSHKEFAEKYHLPFPLLADVDKKTAEAYDVLALGGLFTKRDTFLIDPEGRIAKHYPGVKPAENSAQVLADIQALKAARKKS